MYYSLARHRNDVDPFELRTQGIYPTEEYVKRYNENKAKKDLYDQIENDDKMRADRRQQKADLMANSKFNAASIMPQVRSLVADKLFEQAEADGNAGLSVIDDEQIPVKGGRRTRHKRGAHKKRSGHNKRRSNKKKRISRRR
jgi:hypothetical protein